jgi:2-polyprenyl-3-methyl-5-hydroxy-6-metoxy-1,4-benzoquinol methylase
LTTTALKTALELDIFEVIAQGHQHVEDIARATQCNVRGMSVLLDALCAKDLLDKSDGAYRLTPTSETYLVRSGYGYCVPIYLAWFQARNHFIDFVRTGKATLDLMAPEAEDIWVSYAAPDRVRLPELMELVTKRWTSAQMIPLPIPGASILDIGSGSGFKSFSLLKTDPSARVTAVDSPRVLEITKDVAEALGVSGQVTFQSGDVLTDVPAESFDIVLFGSLLHYFEPDSVIAILLKARRALKPNGMLIIYATCLDDERKSHFGLLSMVDVSNCAPHGQHFNFPEYRSMLEAAGFRNVTLPEPVLVFAVK